MCEIAPQAFKHSQKPYGSFLVGKHLKDIYDNLPKARFVLLKNRWKKFRSFQETKNKREKEKRKKSN